MNIEQLAGSFSEIVTVVDSSYLDEVEFGETKLDLMCLPNDMRDEIKQVISQDGGEVLVARYNELTLCLIPDCGRGGVCSNGYTQWTDCLTLDELEERYLESDMIN